jgi:hypothetical protein
MNSRPFKSAPALEMATRRFKLTPWIGGKIPLWARIIEAVQSPLWVISGHSRLSQRCPLYPQKRTFVDVTGMSALYHKRRFVGALNASPSHFLGHKNFSKAILAALQNVFLMQATRLIAKRRVSVTSEMLEMQSNQP